MPKKHTSRILTYILLSVIVVSSIAACKQKKNKEMIPRHFKDEVRLKITPVKNQGSSSLCWVYAMLATIETEHIMQGDSVNLSPLFTARHFLEEQAVRNYLLNGGKKEISLRGVGSMLLRHLQCYGAMPFDSYRMPEDVDYQRIFMQLGLKVKAHSAQRNGTEKLKEEVGRLLDDALGPMPRFVFMYGCEYTPLEFAHSVCRNDEYEALTSFTHHPFGKSFPLEVPDNYYRDEYKNVNIDELMRRIDKALDGGHPVCWEGDISEPLFLFGSGVAELVDEDKTYTQEDRQKFFEAKQTTDDHCMEIIGRARDEKGRRYYLCKNSWGKKNPYGGLMYLSENYIRMKTIAIFLRCE